MFGKYEIPLCKCWVNYLMKVIAGVKSYDIEAIFKKYYGSLCFYASRYVDNAGAVQDLVQDVFVHMIEVPPTFSTTEHLRNFLYLSVYNSCVNYLKKGVLRVRHEQYVLTHEPVAELPDEEVLTAEVYRRLKEAVDELPAECRKVIQLGYFQGMGNEEIAVQLGISVNTVRAQKMRGKQLLRDKLKYLFPLLSLFPELF